MIQNNLLFQIDSGSKYYIKIKNTNNYSEFFGL